MLVRRLVREADLSAVSMDEVVNTVKAIYAEHDLGEEIHHLQAFYLLEFVSAKSFRK
jgi:hypothetical protein